METEQTKGSEASTVVKGVIGLLILGAGGWYFFGGGLDQQTNKEIERINDQVAVDFVEQYQLAKKSGDLIQICVQAQMVSAGYLQAQDEPNYLKWKDIEKADCARAGL